VQVSPLGGYFVQVGMCGPCLGQRRTTCTVTLTRVSFQGPRDTTETWLDQSRARPKILGQSYGSAPRCCASRGSVFI
jgi:hypothetical protein